MKKILFIAPTLSFSLNDFLFFKKNYIVFFFKIRYSLNPFIYIKLIYKIFKVDLVYIWFGSLLSAYVIFFSKLFKKKVILVAGGYDVANVPEINYGAILNPLKKPFYLYSFNNADIVLPVSYHTQKELLSFFKPKKYKMIYNGINISKYYPNSISNKKNIVLTVVTNLNKLTYKKKGIDIFIEVAKQLPHIDFYIVGKINKNISLILKHNLPNNMSLLGYKQYQDLLSIYQISKVYLQISKHESFGCALAEAMLCECVPVVTNTSALPEVVGNTGFYTKYADITSTAKAIKLALVSNSGKKARERIIKHFSLSKREYNLNKLIKKLLN